MTTNDEELCLTGYEYILERLDSRIQEDRYHN